MDSRADELHDIFNINRQTLLDLADRVEVSEQDMRQIYRETELDEAWRLVDIALADSTHKRATSEVIAHWVSVKNEMMAIHDLVGVDSNLRTAAERLRYLADRMTATTNA